jgi:tetratricopeptide (TPR) repeat protein
VFALLQRLNGGEENKVARDLAAAVAAALWALHPLRVEPVTWVTGLPYHLSLAFLLGATLAYHGVDAMVSPWRQGRFRMSLVLFLLAAMTYPIVLGFPCVLLAIDLARGRDLSLRTPGGRAVWMEKLPFFALAGLTVAGTLYGRLFRVGDWFQAAGTDSFTLAERLTQAGYLWGYYVWKPWWPTGLNPLYDTLLDFSPTEPRFLLSTFGVGLITLVLMMRWRRWRGWAAAWLAHVGLLVPMLGLTEKPHYPHDRYSILNGILWSVLLMAGWSRLSAWGRRVGLGLGLLLAVMAAGSSRIQTAMWQDDIAFFARLADRTGRPDLKAAALMKLGNAHAAAGNDGLAVRQYEQARVSAPGFPLVHLPYNHGTALLRLKRYDEAVMELERARRIDPDHLGVLNNLAVGHRQRGELTTSIALLRQAVERAPGNSELLKNLGATLMDAGDLASAESWLRRSVEADPGSAGAAGIHRRLAEIYRGTDRQELANRHSRRAWELEQKGGLEPR